MKKCLALILAASVAFVAAPAAAWPWHPDVFKSSSRHNRWHSDFGGGRSNIQMASLNGGGGGGGGGGEEHYARENWVPPPHKRCGYTARMALGVRDPAYNLARNWMHYGSPAGGPCVGCLAVSYGHVARIVGQEDGWWIVADDRGTHRMSLAWATTFRVP
jgi:hypothetical protein